MFKKFRNNLFVENYKNDRLHELKKQYNKVNRGEDSAVGVAVMGIGPLIAAIVAAVNAPGLIAALAIAAIGGIICVTVNTVMGNFGFKGGIKIAGEWRKAAARALKTTLKGVDKSVELQKKDPKFNSAKKFAEETSFSACISDLVKDGFKYIFKREEYLKDREREDEEMSSSLKHIEASLGRMEQLSRLVEKAKKAYDDIPEVDKLIMQQRQEKDSEIDALIRKQRLDELKKTSKELRAATETLLKKVLITPFNERAGGSKDLRVQTLLKAEDICKLDKFRLN
jgi:hypothetical protein